MKKYSTEELSGITNIPIRTIQYYYHSELIRPEVELHRRGKGRGKKILFSSNNIIECLLARDLMQKGLHLSVVGLIMEYVRAKRRKSAVDFFAPRVLVNNTHYLFLGVPSQAELTPKERQENYEYLDFVYSNYTEQYNQELIEIYHDMDEGTKTQVLRNGKRKIYRTVQDDKRIIFAVEQRFHIAVIEGEKLHETLASFENNISEMDYVIVISLDKLLSSVKHKLSKEDYK